MKKVIFEQKMTADVESSFVVFLIGMRINKWWQVHQWAPVLLSMPKMLRELYQHPELGFVGAESWFGRTTLMVQYWKSQEDLHAYATNKDLNHVPAWQAFNKKIGASSAVGIWHESYVIQPGSHRSLYRGMPQFGLAKLGKHTRIG
ncbi:MAG: DUF4188 domain-containing protein [Arenicella sp.]